MLPKLLQKKNSYTVDYPAAIKYAETQMDIFWHPNEIEVEKDLHDLKTNFTETEIHGVITTLKLFTLYELVVGNEYWSGKIKKLFPRPDIERMCNCFSFFELNVHAPFYNKLNEVLGLNTDEFYNSYVHDEVLFNRMNWIHKVIDKPTDNIIDILKSIAVFSMIEGAILYSSFAFLKHFQAEGKNKLVNVTAGINFSVRDENCLAKGTEVLTSSGWKNIENITLDDIVAQYVISTKELFWDKPTALYQTKSGLCYEFSGENFHQIVTPEHRMVTKNGIKLAKDCKNDDIFVISSCSNDEDCYYASFCEIDVKSLSIENLYSLLMDVSQNWAKGAVQYFLNIENKSKELEQYINTLANVAGGIIKDNKFIELHYDDTVKKSIHVCYSKDFYCMDVATSTFFVKSNGKISVTGNCHSEAGAWLFKTLLEESQLSEKEIENIHNSILKTAGHIKEHEDRIIDMIFEKGTIKGITDHQLKSFIQHRLDVCLEQLGFKKHFNPSYNPIKNWFYKNINAPQLHDFFYKIGNQYNRNWNEQGFVWKSESASLPTGEDS